MRASTRKRTRFDYRLPRNRTVPVLALLLAAIAVISLPALAQAPAPDNSLGLNIFQTAQNALQPDQLSTTMSVFLLLTVLSLAPAILVMTTSFTRIIVVLGFLRQAMATQQSPPNQVLVGLALILTSSIMAPTYQKVYDEAMRPYMDSEISAQEALDLGMEPVREFMFRQVANIPKTSRCSSPSTNCRDPRRPTTFPRTCSFARSC